MPLAGGGVDEHVSVATGSTTRSRANEPWAPWRAVTGAADNDAVDHDRRFW